MIIKKAVSLYFIIFHIIKFYVLFPIKNFKKIFNASMKYFSDDKEYLKRLQVTTEGKLLLTNKQPIKDTLKEILKLKGMQKENKNKRMESSYKFEQI